jgi:hypothetical protein
MNQKGEATLLCVLLIVVISSLLTLSVLELGRTFSNIQNRTKLFLCTKETKGEIDLYLKFMGRTNWGLKNITKASLLMIFIPGLQGAALSTPKIKRIIKQAQNIRLLLYLKTLGELKKKGCPLDPRMAMTPFKLSVTGHERDLDETVIMRNKEWKYHFTKGSYFLQLTISEKDLESLFPKIEYKVEEKLEKFSFL